MVSFCKAGLRVPEQNDLKNNKMYMIKVNIKLQTNESKYKQRKHMFSHCIVSLWEVGKTELVVVIFMSNTFINTVIFNSVLWTRTFFSLNQPFHMVSTCGKFFTLYSHKEGSKLDIT